MSLETDIETIVQKLLAEHSTVIEAKIGDLTRKIEDSLDNIAGGHALLTERVSKLEATPDPQVATPPETSAVPVAQSEDRFAALEAAVDKLRRQVHSVVG